MKTDKLEAIKGFSRVVWLQVCEVVHLGEGRICLNRLVQLGVTAVN